MKKASRMYLTKLMMSNDTIMAVMKVSSKVLLDLKANLVSRSLLQRNEVEGNYDCASSEQPKEDDYFVIWVKQFVSSCLAGGAAFEYFPIKELLGSSVNRSYLSLSK